MQILLIVLLVLAAIIALVFAAFVITAFVITSKVLGARKTSADLDNKTDENGVDMYGVRAAWFDEVKPFTDSFTITAFDGVKLGGKMIRHEQKADNVAIVCHGYGVSALSMQKQAQLFYDKGFDVLMPCMRGHLGSEGKVGMGWLDRYDVLRWVDMVIEQYGKNVKIALMGMSMGGASVIGAAGMNPPPQVKCVIDDCGFASQCAVYLEKISKKKLPKSLTLFMLYIGVRLMHGYSISDADFAPLAEKVTIPALFFHGESDSGVSIAQGRTLFDACSSRDKRFVSFEGAEHAMCFASDPDKYMTEFNSFVDKYFE